MRFWVCLLTGLSLFTCSPREEGNIRSSIYFTQTGAEGCEVKRGTGELYQQFDAVVVTLSLYNGATQTYSDKYKTQYSPPSNYQGEYQINQIAPGTYKITITGCKGDTPGSAITSQYKVWTGSSENIQINPNAQTNLNVFLTKMGELNCPGWSGEGSGSSSMQNRVFHTATLLKNGKVLLTGGFNQINGDQLIATNTADLYDPQTGTFSPVSSSLAKARGFHSAVGAVLDGKAVVFFIGGADQLAINLTNGNLTPANVISEIEYYDPDTGVFMPLSSGLIGSKVIFNTATEMAAGNFFVAGGFSGIQYLDALYYYLGGNYQLTRARGFHTTTPLTDNRYLVWAGDISGTDLQSIAEIFDAKNNQSRVVPVVPMNGGNWMMYNTAFHTTSDLGYNRMMIFGGFKIYSGAPVMNPRLESGYSLYILDFNYAPPAYEVFDLNDIGATAPDELFYSAFHTANVVYEKATHKPIVAIIGGVKPSATNQVFVGSNKIVLFYDEGNIFNLSLTLPEGRFGHTVTLLNDGTLLIAGGLTGFTGSSNDFVPQANNARILNPPQKSREQCLP